MKLNIQKRLLKPQPCRILKNAINTGDNASVHATLLTNPSSRFNYKTLFKPQLQNTLIKNLTSFTPFINLNHKRHNTSLTQNEFVVWLVSKRKCGIVHLHTSWWGWFHGCSRSASVLPDDAGQAEDSQDHTGPNPQPADSSFKVCV